EQAAPTHAARLRWESPYLCAQRWVGDGCVCGSACLWAPSSWCEGMARAWQTRRRRGSTLARTARGRRRAVPGAPLREIAVTASGPRRWSRGTDEGTAPVTSTRMSRAQQVDAATPGTRNRVVDFLRAAAMTVVVLGHWTISAVDADGGIRPHGVLDRATWPHPLTWMFYVMPIFFLLSGSANGLSWRSARRESVGYA